MKILFLVPYPVGQAPSQRFRFEQYFGTLAENHIEYDVKSFLSPNHWKLFYTGGNFFRKLKTLMVGFAKRARTLLEVHRYDFIFIHREVAPIGPPVFEWIIAKLLAGKIIYDFDDAIWMTDKTSETWLEKKIRFRSKVRKICKWSYRISAGNDYLSQYAQLNNSNVVINPTTIDTEHVHKFKSKDFSNGRILIGWTGSHSTLKYLSEIEEALIQIESKYDHVDFCVIADKPPSLRLKSIDFRPWSLTMEISDLSQFDIGIMPLPNNEWSKGKCGFKALQYMALGIPTVVSPVGVNQTIITHGANGFLAKDTKAWVENLSQLIDDKNLRNRIGAEGKITVDRHYSVKANRQRFLDLFK